jgi:hypothetical protein
MSMPVFSNGYQWNNSIYIQRLTVNRRYCFINLEVIGPESVKI